MFRDKSQSAFFVVCTALIPALVVCGKNEEKSPTAPEGAGAQFTMPHSIKEVGQFFDFSTGQAIEALSPVSAWDVGFQNKAMEGLGITLNFGKGGRVLNTGRTDFGAVSMADTTGEMFVLDASWNDPSAVAIADWFNMPKMGDIESKQEVYILAFMEGTEIVYTKFQMLGYADGKYTFKFARLPNGPTTSGEVSMGGDTHWLCYSFSAQAVVPFEPSKEAWDLYFGPVVVRMGTSYRAVGRILPNVGSGVQVAVSDEGVVLDDLKVADWVGKLETIHVLKGWYRFDHATKTYSYPVRSYLVKTAEGQYAGFQILSYQSAGKSGYPTFVYKYNMQ